MHELIELSILETRSQIVRFVSQGLVLLIFLIGMPTIADSPEPAICEMSRSQLQTNKKLVLDFFSFTGPIDAAAKRFLTKDYIQHNPRLLRMDEITGSSGRDAWIRALRESDRRGVDVVNPGIPRKNPIIIMAECDLVTAVYKGVVDDPDRQGHTYEAFSFETFRIRGGMLAEHWDQVTLDKGWMR